MTALTHDAPTIATRPSTSLSGLGLAVVSAASFGLSGALAGGMMAAGWSAAGAVTVRVGLAALVLLGPALVALDGRWSLLRTHLRTISVYGVVAVAGCQLAYFNAVRHMQVAPALLIEYTAPVVVLGWLWFRHGHRPTRLTVAGAGLAALGLVLVLDLVSGTAVSLPGILWALGATAGAAVYFVLSAEESDLPPLVLAAGGLIVGTAVLLLAGVLGVVRLTGSTSDVAYAVGTVPFWVPVVGLGVIAAAVAYVTGIAASRRLGSRVASFVALLEVLFALVFAWVLRHEIPEPVQFAGAALVLAGVVLVKIAERD